MTKRIFRSIFLVALAVFIAGTALIMGALYSYFSGVYEEQIQEEASYLSRQWRRRASATWKTWTRRPPHHLDRRGRRRPL